MKILHSKIGLSARLLCCALLIFVVWGVANLSFSEFKFISVAVAADPGCDKLSEKFKEFGGDAPGALVEQCTSSGGAIKRGINIGLGLASGLAVLFLVIGAVRYMTASGNEINVKAAIKSMQWSVAGLALILLAYAIVAMVSSLATGSNPLFGA